MGNFLTMTLAAFWLGILTSISPCPLATNIAAISFIGKRVGHLRTVLLSGIIYSLGRMMTYLAVGVVVVTGLLSIPSVSLFLQKYMIMILGPVLVLTGMFLLELITINLPGVGFGTTAEKLVGKGDILGAGLLGILFALSFCPVSAALFFGSLIPLAVREKSMILMPSLYGIGTGLPVLAFAVLIAVSAKSVGVVFNKLTAFEKWARYATGAVFIGIGIFLSLRYIFFAV
ncbi:aromatic aminobenezylarsenical efflux permease ArsG family transporter [Candidatus Latescibacterota bacterium]